MRCSVHDLLPEAVAGASACRARGCRAVGGRRAAPRRPGPAPAARTPRYVPEVPVDATVEVDGWSSARPRPRRRRDRDADDRPVVEEIKTLHFRCELHDLFAHERLERFRWQARIYAFCLFPEGEAAHGCASSTSAARTSSASRTCRGRPARCRPTCAAGCTPWSPPSASAEHPRSAGAPPPRCSRSPSRAAARCRPRRWRRSTRASPTGRHLLLAAPTGIGKTAAALFPGRARWRCRPAGASLFLTAKTLQQQLAVETLQRMQRRRLALDPAPRQGARCAPTAR